MPTISELQILIKKYNLAKSGTKLELAKRIYSLRSIYLTSKEKKMLEELLHMPDKKKDKRTRKRRPN